MCFMCHMSAVSKEAIYVGSPETGVIESCKPPEIGTEN